MNLKSVIELYAHRMIASAESYSEKIRQDGSLKGKTEALITLDHTQSQWAAELRKDKAEIKAAKAEERRNLQLAQVKSAWFSGKNTEKSFF